MGAGLRGETLACGTGACAVAVSCVLNGLTDPEVTVKLLGGDLFHTVGQRQEQSLYDRPCGDGV